MTIPADRDGYIEGDEYTVLDGHEAYWSEKAPWLLSKGYRLRRRYQPGWVASWKLNPRLFWLTQEDYAHYVVGNVMDAVHTDTGKLVMLKKVWKDSNEIEIIEYLNSPSMIEESKKYTIRVIEIIQDIPGDEDYSLLVMPFLQMLDYPERFDTVGECLDCVLQMLKAVQFLHRHNIAHRDCTTRNFVMDAPGLYPNGFHPIYRDLNPDCQGFAKHRTRTQCPARYLLIDFGLSIRYPEGVTERVALPVRGNDYTVPEFQDKEMLEQPYDPFPTDIYYAGNAIRDYFTNKGDKEFVPGKLGMSYLNPLVRDMTRENPCDRPTIDEAVTRMEAIINSRWEFHLRASVRHPDDSIFGTIHRFLPYLKRRVSFMVNRVHPIPSRNACSRI